MSKSRNPGYQGGNNWGICDRCGQAYRQTELVDQHDGLRVCVHDCYDKRHPQEAVRDKGWECGGDGAAGTGLDWNGAGRLARPDVDPLSFIQEPNDAYFTTIPVGTFGQGANRAVAPQASLDCCSAESVLLDVWTDPLLTWHTATDLEELGVQPASNLTLDTGNVISFWANSCFNTSCSSYVAATFSGTGSTRPEWVENTVTGADGSMWPAVRFSPGKYFATPINYGSRNPASGYEYITAIFVLNNVQDANKTIIKTQNGIYDGQQYDEGIRTYMYEGKLHVGFRCPAGPAKHPGYPTATNDIDVLGVPLNTDGPTIVEVHWEPSQTKVVKDGGLEVYTDASLGGYWPNGYSPNLRVGTSSVGATFDLLDMFVFVPNDGEKLSSNVFKKITDALSWKYNIPVKKT